MSGMEQASKMEYIKNNFQEKAQEYDALTQSIIPYYSEMLNALTMEIPYGNSEEIEVMDLGCGTGMVALRVKQLFPNSKITCVDISPNMLEVAKNRLSQYEGITYRIVDFYDMDFDRKYQVIVSSLALHHLINDEDKKTFYFKIFNSLNEGGVFYNADVVLGSNDFIQNSYIQKWVEFMKKTNTMEEIMNIRLPRYYEEDTPTSLIKHLHMLGDIGYKDIDVIWKYYNFSVYGGKK